MKTWNRLIFFVIGWVGGIAMATAHDILNKVIILGVTMLVYSISLIWSGIKDDESKNS